ncbi:hypothetical protein E3P92_03734 [Wallemia ichthyophaga]|uniref:Tetrapyrrole methylase domain-containing protein n=2 Tax=Wallemia ichthyophaga TaxID=245174 RepID=A0A4T0H1Z5_WALIC|nr:hypothetical protein E3P91_03777 [Wallemia ichthyophaga]TIA87742.1 hypothetical protein E3P97_03812 [Wallemia ichthyophaga]TIA95385.1 hypothetical protein E3P95_03728 [Wallemia ichthyophaga]TIA96349.1 hypothetical protein E3P94_03724 [Wallemia ichthyophaga]TIA98017.1 hypothetical protein E3P96_03258 [Wallemia ichthyophaga]
MYKSPAGHGSLLIALNSTNKSLIVIGHNSLAASRSFAGLDAGCNVVVIGCGLDSACDEIKFRVSADQIEYLTATSHSQLEAAFRSCCTRTSTTIATITDCGINDSHDNSPSIHSLVQLSHSLNIPINVTDHPLLCDFSFPTSHRFSLPDGSPSPLQLAVTTNSKGCRLASRIKRETIALLPKNIGSAVHNIGLLRSRAKRYLSRMKLERTTSQSSLSEELADFDNLNAAVPQLSRDNTTEHASDKALRRMRWVAQISEYWPLEHLAKMDEADIDSLLDAYGEPHQPRTPKTEFVPQWPLPPPHDRHALSLAPPQSPKPRKGHIVLVGAGLGSPELLTIAAYRALKTADLVLSDKLVPAAVLKVVPQSTEVRIARKFPGNAEGAQAELMQWAVDGARSGQVVVRLKQGDPFVYGRGGEEVIHFRREGYEAVVVPGLSSAMAAPLMGGIPVTQRGASDSFLLCTGVGRGGRVLSVPEYARARTLTILMGVARLRELVESLAQLSYPPFVPVAVIEQASSPSQRVVMSTLDGIVKAYEGAGDQRPPGMIVVGWSILSLHGEHGDLSVLDEDAEKHDQERVHRWLNGKLSIITEGPGRAWDEWLKEVERPVTALALLRYRYRLIMSLRHLSRYHKHPSLHKPKKIMDDTEISATTVPGLIPPTPALSRANSPQQSPLEAGPVTPAAPSPVGGSGTGNNITEDSPLASPFASLLDLARHSHWGALSHAAFTIETVYAVSAQDALWEGVHAFGALAQLMAESEVPVALNTLDRCPAPASPSAQKAGAIEGLRIVAHHYSARCYTDALKALSQLKKEMEVKVDGYAPLINESTTRVFADAVGALQDSTFSRILNVLAKTCSALPLTTVGESVGWFVGQKELVGVLKKLNWRLSDDGLVVYPTYQPTQSSDPLSIQNVATSVFLLESN